MWNNDFEWLKDETVVYETGIHKYVIFQAIFALFPVAFLLIFFFIMDFPSIVYIVFFILFGFICVLLFIPQYMFWKKSFLIVTNKRIVYRIGWIHQNVGEILLNRLIGINVEQGFMSRLLNYGTIKFNGDNDTLQPLSMIANPFELKRQVMGQINKEE
jgi:uncharacterized membrane protein YdbT with pleckstrin-like domain